MNLSSADGSVLIAYANSRADTNDILEELLEAYIKHQLNSNPDITEAHLAAFLTEVDKHLPGKSILPKNKKPGEYTRSDLVEAYSRLALASYIYQEAHLPLSPGGHQLLQNIGKILDTAHVFKTIGDAWHTYANSPEGKAHLANGGKQLADILRESGFKVGSLVAQAKATAQQQIETIEAANWQPDIEAELDALLEEAEAEQQLAEINEQEAKEPITIPAEESITGQEITIEPQQEEPIVNRQSSIVNPLLSLITQGKAKTQDFARFFRDNPSITDAQATELGIRPLTQRGTPTAAYTQGRLIAAKLTPQQFDDYLTLPLELRTPSDNIVTIPLTPQPADPTNFSIKPQQKALREEYREERQRTGKLNKAFTKNVSQVVEKRKDTNGKNVWALTKKSKHVIEVCPYPFILNQVKPWQGNVVITANVVQKLLNKHNLTLHDIGQLPSEISDPVAILQERENDKIVLITDIRSKNNRGETKHTKVILHLRKTKQGVEIADVKSAYSADHKDSFLHAINKDRLLYVDKQRALNWAATEGRPISQLLQTVLSDKGSAIILKDDLVNVNPENQTPATESPDLFTDGVLEAENAIITKPDVNFSIKPAAADTLDRFTVDPLGERIIHHIRTESRRYARLLGDKTPYEQAVNAAQSAASIIGAVDKFLHTPGKPVPARYRRQLQKLRSIAEKYAQIIASGTPRSFKKISPQEKQELEAAIAELEAQELDTATTESDQLLTDSDRLTKREAAARAREHHRAIVRSAAKGRVYQTLSSMLEISADALDSYLKHQLLQKLDRLTATVKIKRSPSKRLQGKMTAPAYRELERAINNMALSPCAHETGMAQLNSTSMPS